MRTTTDLFSKRGEREVKFGFQQTVLLSALLRFSDKALVILQSRLKTKSGDTLEDYLKDIAVWSIPKIEGENPKGG